MAKKKTRLNRFSDLTWNDIEEWVGGKIVSRGKTKAQLIGLIHDLAQRYPEMAMDLSDRQQLISGNTKTLVTRLREEIRDIGNEPGWQNYWKGEGYTPDYSGIRKKLETLLQAAVNESPEVRANRAAWRGLAARCSSLGAPVCSLFLASR